MLLIVLDSDHIAVKPLNHAVKLDDDLKMRITEYWTMALVLETEKKKKKEQKKKILSLLPDYAPTWAKLRVDALRTTIRTSRADFTGRKASYVRVSSISFSLFLLELLLNACSTRIAMSTRRVKISY